MASLGVTTVEVKSGYGLERSARAQAARRHRARRRSERPPRRRARRSSRCTRCRPARRIALPSSARVARELVPEVGRERLARFVDAYVDADAFTRRRGARRLRRGAGRGARRAPSRRAVRRRRRRGAGRLARRRVRRSPRARRRRGHRGARPRARGGRAPPRRELHPGAAAAARERGCATRASLWSSRATPTRGPRRPRAFRSRWPCASAFTASRPTRRFLAATRNAAAALDLTDRGVLRVGARADLVVWDLPHEHAIVQPWGVKKTRAVFVEGRSIVSPEDLRVS